MLFSLLFGKAGTQGQHGKQSHLQVTAKLRPSYGQVTPKLRPSYAQVTRQIWSQVTRNRNFGGFSRNFWCFSVTFGGFPVTWVFCGRIKLRSSYGQVTAKLRSSVLQVTAELRSSYGLSSVKVLLIFISVQKKTSDFVGKPEKRY